MQPTRGAPHIPELDGLRAIAIGLVMLFHFTTPVVPTWGAHVIQSVTRGGWIGVDLFFVLSGFLITGICLDHQGPGFFRAFYARRALRIFPAYFLVVGVITAVSLSVTGRLPVGQLWITTFTTNIATAHARSLTVVPSMAGHLWSVAVEEQFYLVWPLCVAVLPRRLAVACALIAIPSAALMRGWFLFVDDAPLAAHELTIARMDALATGAVLAFVARSRYWPAISKRAALVAKSTPPAIWILGGLVICFALSTPVMTRATTAAHLAGVLRYSALSIVGGMAVTLGASAHGEGPLGKVLTQRHAQWIGRRSYAMYLIHLPVGGILGGAVFLPRNAISLVTFVAVATVITCALAELSWRTVEQPALRLKRFVRYPTIAAANTSGRNMRFAIASVDHQNSTQETLTS